MNRVPTDTKNANQKIDEENGSNFTEFFIKGLGLLIVLPLALAYFHTIRLATRQRIWRIKELTRKFIWASIFCTPVALLLDYFSFTTFSIKNWLPSVSCLFASWIFLIPLAGLITSQKLTEISQDISEYKYPIKYLASTQRAILENAFRRAERIFLKLNRKLPIYGSKGRAVLALDANPRDYRGVRYRRVLPDTYSITSSIDEDFIVFDQNSMSPKSHLVIGGTGSGKTRLLSRMALSSLAEDWRVVIFDFKGGDEERLEFSSLGDFLPEKNVVVQNYPGSPIDMFKGSREDVADRLISCLPAPTGGDGDYHRQRAVRAINAVVIRTGADIPRDIEEVLRRIRIGEAYADDELDREMFKQKEKGVPVGQIIAESVASRFEPLRRTGEWGTSGGFSWSDSWDLAVFSLDATREREITLGDLILMDFDMWLKSNDRERQPKPILLICDEAGVLEKLPRGSVNLLNIVARGRSSRVGVVIASQTLASLGENYVGLNEQIASKWIGRTTNPEELINTIGTKEVIEASYELGMNGWELPKSGRQQRAYKIDPDVIRQLPTFYWNTSEAGKSRFIYAPPLRPR